MFASNIFLYLRTEKKNWKKGIAMYDKAFLNIASILYHGRCLIRSRNCLAFASTWVRPGFLWGRVALPFSFMRCIFCFVCLRPVSCVCNVANVSGLSILDCPFGFSPRCINLIFKHNQNKTVIARQSWSGDHTYPRIPNFAWGNERNETCFDLSYNLFISWPSKIYKFL